jgi:alpha-1,6-mannosyltransferase
MTDPTRRMAMLSAIGATLVGLVVVGLAALDWNAASLEDSTPRVVAFVVSICLAGLLWLLAVAVVRRDRLPPCMIWIVLGVAVSMRVITLVSPPVLSSDVYRYVWDGRVQLAGISPYRYLPVAPELAFLRDDAVYPHINRADYAPTLYPPAAQAIFALAAAVTPGVFGMKLMMAAFDALAIAALAWLLRIAGREPSELLIYAWLPLPVWEFAGNAHVDAAAAGLLALTLLAAVRGRAASTGVVLATATLTKFLPVVVLPAFWRPPGWRLMFAFAATLVIFYLPYVTAGWHVLGFLGGYASEEGLENGHAVFLLQLLGSITTLPGWASPMYFAIALGVLGLLGAGFAFGGSLPTAPGVRLTLQARQAVILGAALLVVVSPHYPWYFGWLAPLACIAPLTSVLWMLAAAPLLAHGSFEYLAVPGVVYGPAVVLAVFDLHRIRTRPLPIPSQAVRSVR